MFAGRCAAIQFLIKISSRSKTPLAASLYAAASLSLNYYTICKKIEIVRYRDFWTIFRDGFEKHRPMEQFSILFFASARVSLVANHEILKKTFRSHPSAGWRQEIVWSGTCLPVSGNRSFFLPV